MLAVMQLKLPMELAEDLRKKLSELRTKTADPELLRKLTFNNLLRCYIWFGMNSDGPIIEDDDILNWIKLEGMSRGRPSSES